MRHRKLRGKLGVTSSHREAMLRNLLLSLFKHERIRTTIARAKQLKRFADQMIEMGKTDDWWIKREVRRHVHDKEALNKLFTVYGPRFKERSGGYTRIFHLGSRHGDAAQMGLIEILPDPKKENEPRIIKREKGKAVTEEEAKAKKEAKKAKKEAKKLKEKEAKARAEAKLASEQEDFTHSHKSRGRKTERGTGRSKTSKRDYRNLRSS